MSNAIKKMALLYIMIPVFVYCVTWIRWYIALFAILALIFFYIKISGSIDCDLQFCRNHKMALIFSCFCLFLWVFLIGLTKQTYQNDDFWVRNPIFRDLCTYRWPIIYDLSLEPSYVQEILGSNKVAFTYYFSWW